MIKILITTLRIASVSAEQTLWLSTLRGIEHATPGSFSVKDDAKIARFLQDHDNREVWLCVNVCGLRASGLAGYEYLVLVKFQTYDLSCVKAHPCPALRG